MILIIYTDSHHIAQTTVYSKRFHIHEYIDIHLQNNIYYKNCKA
jgi:hypothetical protein